MTATQDLHKLGQSLWLDNITRGILDNGTLQTLHRRAVGDRPDLEPDHFRRSDRRLRPVRQEHPAEGAQPACRARPCSSSWRSRICAAPPICSGRSSTAPRGIDGWVSMEVSPLLANDTQATIEAAKRIHKLADRPNLYVKIPGTPEGVPAIEEAIFAGVPVNVTLLFSREQYLAVAEAYMRGIERRIAAKLDPRVSSVASLFVSRWDRAVAGKVPAELRNRLGIADRRAHLPRALRLAREQALARSRGRGRGASSACCGPAPA